MYPIPVLLTLLHFAFARSTYGRWYYEFKDGVDATIEQSSPSYNHTTLLSFPTIRKMLLIHCAVSGTAGDF
jgi:hypothetical protein